MTMIAPALSPTLTEIPRSLADGGFADAVRIGLSAGEKRLPSCYFYDDAGSALFEKITRLPEYYPTRTEDAILAAHACEMLDGYDGADLIEFGAGSGIKTRRLLRALGPRGRYVPIDICGGFLNESMALLAADHPGVRFHGLAGDWTDAVDHLPERTGPRVFLFLGSSIGNLSHGEAAGFLKRVAARMIPGDAFLLGVDRTKNPAIVEAAYDDREGVTEAFNKNLLARANRELGAEFPLHRFRHRAHYDHWHDRIEMRLEIRDMRTVTIAALDMEVSFGAGETILTEWSHKYSVGSLTDLATTAGLSIERVFSDPQEWFSVLRLEVAR